jgi:HK97 family phage prohead protease
MEKTHLPTKQFIAAEKGVLDRENQIVSGVIGSSGVIDRHGESLNPMGWKLENYLKNPIVLFGHDMKSLPIGKALKVWIEDAKLMFTLKFANTEMGKTVFQLFEEEILNAVSVGFIPLKWDETGEFTFAEMELLELSVVPVPANPEALARMKTLLSNIDQAEEIVESCNKAIEIEPEIPAPATEVKTVTIPLDELLPVIKQAVSEVINIKNDVPIEPTDEPSDAPQDDEIPPSDDDSVQPEAEHEEDTKEAVGTLSVLTAMRDQLRKSDKELGLALGKLNKLVAAKENV